MRTLSILLCAAGLIMLAACGGESLSDTTEEAANPDTATAGLELPEGFTAELIAQDLGEARHLTVRENGDVYVRLRDMEDGPGIVALRDTDGDGEMDVTEYFGDEEGGTGIDIRDDYLYVSTDQAVYRYELSDEELVPEGEPETVIEDFPDQQSHAAKSFAFDGEGGLYVNVGGPSNACQEESRTEGSAGQDPCPQLERQGGVWRFDADQTGQTQTADGERYATGIRNSVALDWNDAVGNLYVVQHGRDQLHEFWPDLFTQEESAELPAEEFLMVEEAGANFGWPYCYYDQEQEEKVLAPEYGGDGEEIGRCEEFEDPILAFPGHWGPNDLLFYTGEQFPERYRNGAFIAFHGSWNRAPSPQEGYRVVFVPFDGDQPTGDDWEDFALGFAGVETIKSPGDAEHRPMGLAQGPDGSLYISDSVEGYIWRVAASEGAEASTD